MKRCTDGGSSTLERWAAVPGAWWPRHRIAFVALGGCVTLADVFLGDGWNTFAPMLAWGLLFGLHFILARSLAMDDEQAERRTADLRLRAYDQGHIDDIGGAARPRHRRPPPLLGPRAELPPLALRRAPDRGAARRLPRHPAELSGRRLPARLGRPAGRRLRVRRGGVGSDRFRQGRRRGRSRSRPRPASPPSSSPRRGSAGRTWRRCWPLRRASPGCGGYARSRRWPLIRTRSCLSRPAR